MATLTVLAAVPMGAGGTDAFPSAWVAFPRVEAVWAPLGTADTKAVLGAT